MANETDYATASPSDAERFAAFVDAVSSAPVEVTKNGCPTSAISCPYAPTDQATSATVRYHSPSQGELTFGWAPGAERQVPLTVDGKAFDLHPDAYRWDAPYAKAAWDQRTYHAELDGATLDLDFAKNNRRTTR